MVLLTPKGSPGVSTRCNCRVFILVHHSLFIEFKTLDEVGDLDASRTANSAVTPRRKMRVKVGAP